MSNIKHRIQHADECKLKFVRVNFKFSPELFRRGHAGSEIRVAFQTRKNMRLSDPSEDESAAIFPVSGAFDCPVPVRRLA